MPNILPPPTRQRTLKDIAYLQECLSEQVDFFLVDLLRSPDDAEDEAWNAKVHALHEAWKEGQGPFAAEVGRHIEKICDAVKDSLQ